MGFGAAAVLTAGALAMGCGDDSDSVVASILLTDNYPGSQIFESNVANDGRAFSNQGWNADDHFALYWNTSNGQAIALYELEQAGGGDNILMAHYYNGSSWGPGTQIRGENEYANPDINGFKALWLNTAGNADPETAARNGDAIILFVRRDRDPIATSTTDEDENDRLYGSYFDVSQATAPAVGTILNGFETNAIAIDDDNQTTGDDPDVSTFGFVSDSLVCTHEFSDSTDVVDSGDPTTFVHIVWRKDPLTGSGTDVGERYNSILFDMTQVGNDLPTASSSNVIDIPGDTTNQEDVNSSFVVHNQHMFYDVTNVADSATSDDRILLGEVFGDTATSDQIELGSAQQDNSDDNSFQPAASDVYGADHGLASTYFFFRESGFNDDSTAGDRASNTDLMLGELRVDGTTGVTTYSSDSPLEIDLWQGTIELDSADTDAVAGLDGTNGNVFSQETRINRTGSYIAVVYRAQNEEITDLDNAAGDTTLTSLGATNTVPFMTVVQTRTDSADTRAISDSIADTTDFDTFNSAGDSDGTPAVVDQGDVNFVDFQFGLAQGQAVGQSEEICDRGCTFQGNNLRFAVLHQQIGDQTPTASDDNTLYLNSFTVTLGATETDEPTVDASQGDVETLDTGWSDLTDAFAVDAGDITVDSTGAPTATAGRVMVYFDSQDNNETDETTSSSLESRRLFVSEEGATAGSMGTKVLISSDSQFQADDRQFDELLGGELVPVNEDTVGSPNHVGTTFHAYWLEVANQTRSNRRLATRSYDQADTTAASPSVVLADRFVPALESSANAPSQPAFIDLPTDGLLTDLTGPGFGQEFFTARNGNTVGVYFSEDEHIYYQETSSDASAYYKDATGLFDPQLVDNDSVTGIRTIGWALYSPPECDNLQKGMVFFGRDDLSQINPGPLSTAIRFYTRIHN